MAENEKHDSDADSETSAADEPTAIWDIDALRAAGLDALLSQPESEPPRRPTSTPPVSAEPSMMIATDELDSGGEGNRDTPDIMPATPPEALRESIAPVEMRPGFEGATTRRYGWGAALGAGALFFGAVYALIRFLL